MLDQHPIVSHEDWIAARRNFLEREKEFTRIRDRLSQERRELPWERVEKNYVFEGPDGEETLSELFGGRSQLVVYHFMYGPGWQNPCRGCSFWADNIERNVVHLAARDVTLVVCSRARYAELLPFKRRMGWTFKWVSSYGSDFNYDYQVSFADGEPERQVEYNYTREGFRSSDLPGISVFYRDPQGAIFHTYSTYARGLDMLNAAYHYLDLVPKGRDEADQQPHPMAWLRYGDSYGA